MGRRPYSRFPLQGRSVSRPPPSEKTKQTIATATPSPSSIPSPPPFQRNASLCVCALVVPLLRKKERILQEHYLFGETSTDTVGRSRYPPFCFILIKQHKNPTNANPPAQKGPVSVILSYSTLGTSKLHFIHERHDHSKHRTLNISTSCIQPTLGNTTTVRTVSFDSSVQLSFP